MSEETVRLAREGYDAWMRGDLDAVLAIAADDFEFRSRPNLLGIPELLRGKEGLRDFFAEWYSGPWKGRLEMEVHDFIDLGDDRVLALVTFRGRDESGAGVEFAHVLRYGDGSLLDMDAYPSWDEGLRAVGLSERSG
jgi:ketosteroid isomerase-like protein